jgi:chromosome segregation ATPase
MSRTESRKRYSPSYYRYLKEHPAVVVRLTKERKKILDDFMRAKSLTTYAEAIDVLLTEKGDFMKLQAELIDARNEIKKLNSENETLRNKVKELNTKNESLRDDLTKLENENRDFREIGNEAITFLKGYSDFMEGQIAIPCSRCGKPIVKDKIFWTINIEPYMIWKWKHPDCDVVEMQNKQLKDLIERLEELLRA